MLNPTIINKLANVIPIIFNDFMASPLWYFTNMSYADLVIVYHKHYIITLIVKLKIHQVVKNLVVRTKILFNSLKTVDINFSFGLDSKNLHFVMFS